VIPMFVASVLLYGPPTRTKRTRVSPHIDFVNHRAHNSAVEEGACLSSRLRQRIESFGASAVWIVREHEVGDAPVPDSTELGQRERWVLRVEVGRLSEKERAGAEPFERDIHALREVRACMRASGCSGD
jgi:hypothetical protein